jgi:hypothetical protein
MRDQLPPARAGHQHVAHVAPDDGARRAPEQGGGRDRPRDHPTLEVEHEGAEVGQVRFAPAGQPGLTVPGRL